jgi:hypothetical protein
MFSASLITIFFFFFRSIDEAEWLLDQVPPPDKDEDELVTKLRNKLRMFLTELRDGAEGKILDYVTMMLVIHDCI